MDAEAYSSDEMDKLLVETVQCVDEYLATHENNFAYPGENKYNFCIQNQIETINHLIDIPEIKIVANVDPQELEHAQTSSYFGRALFGILVLTVGIGYCMWKRR